MTILSTFGGTSGVDTGDIGHSLRFRGAQYLSKTLAAPTSNTGWALSVFLKRSDLPAANSILISSGYSAIGFNSSQLLTFWDSGGGQIANSAAIYRDPTSQGHLFVRSNGTNIKGYWNNVEVLSYTGTIPGINSAAVHNIGRMAALAAQYFGGYASRFCFVDNGGTLTPGDFGYLNTEINEWVSKSQSAVKAVVDAGGTNSFMLDFDDATSLTTLGYDKSSKGNNWTLNNFSLTAGTTYDHMLDVPGNSFATLNPLWRGANVAPTDGNLTNSLASGSPNAMGPTQVLLSGKGYAELHNTSSVGDIGLCVTAANLANMQFIIGVTAATGLWEIYDNAIGIFSTSDGAGFTGSLGATRFLGATVKQFAWDVDAGKFWFGVDNTWYDSSWGTTGNPAAGTNPSFTVAASRGPFNICAGSNGATNSLYWMFGQAPLHASATYQSAAGGYFRCTPPAGFKALCQANLPDPTILNPELHMDVVTVTKSGNTNFTIPWNASTYDTFFEIKRRDAAGDWYQIDGLRGYDKILKSNSTAAETTDANVLGVSGTTGTLKSTLADGTYVVTMHKAGLTASRQTNTDGSITSTVSRNMDSGFAIVTYTGNFTAGATFGHGLGKALSMVVAKNRSSAFDWPVAHQGAGWTTAGLLNLTNSFGASSYFNSVAPTTTVVALGANNLNNQNASLHVAYCHADIEGYSKAFSIVMNSSVDGAYADLGFKAKHVTAKRSDSTSDWFVKDSIRSPSNVATAVLSMNTTAAEATSGFDVDIDTFAIKLRTSLAGTYIGMAYADVAGKYSLGR